MSKGIAIWMIGDRPATKEEIATAEACVLSAARTIQAWLETKMWDRPQKQAGMLKLLNSAAAFIVAFTDLELAWCQEFFGDEEETAALNWAKAHPIRRRDAVKEILKHAEAQEPEG